MRIKFIFPFLAALVLVLSGCATLPTQEELANADYGEYPFEYEEIVKAYFGTILIDPYSAHYMITVPVSGYFTKPPILGGGLEAFGYKVDAYVNSKNRMGGYTGTRKYQVLIKNGVVIKCQETVESMMSH
jgi:hypothetical protein